MAGPKPYQEIHSIVFVGDFNPSIFQPAWFGANGLIGAKEREEAKVEIIHSEIAAFKMSWLECRVTRERFHLSSSQEAYFRPLRDLALATFSLLEHTPLKLLGINITMHYQCESVESWHKIGDKLAPKEPWGATLVKPGLRSLKMEGKRPDAHLGYVHVTLEPSVIVTPGVYVYVNDHYQVPTPTDAVWSARDAREILSAEWEASLKRSRGIAEELVIGRVAP